MEETTASIVGTEAAVFVPSGIMANQLAISLLTEPGDEILCDEWGHIRNYELGAASYFSTGRRDT
ncbi:MAG: beta-eliminating lyase-related protein [Acidimicrobiia bacterium]